MHSILSTLLDGLLGSGLLILPTLGVALLYSHGKYLPIWLPEVGVLGLYITHATWQAGYSATFALLCGWATSVLLALLVHRGLMLKFVENGSNGEPLSCLLLGVGISAALKSLMAGYGRGMSQQFPANELSKPIFISSLGITYRLLDLISWSTVACTIACLVLFLGRTNLGTQVRATISNRQLAKHYYLPVGRLDATVLSLAATFAFMGVLFRGLRFDLQPNMMLYPGLIAVAACAAAGGVRIFLPVFLVVGMEIIERISSGWSLVSSLSRALPLTILLGLVIIRFANSATSGRRA